MPHVIETYQSDRVMRSVSHSSVFVPHSPFRHEMLLTSVIASISKLVRTLCNYLTPYLPSIIKRVSISLNTLVEYCVLLLDLYSSDTSIVQQRPTFTHNVVTSRSSCSTSIIISDFLRCDRKKRISTERFRTVDDTVQTIFVQRHAGRSQSKLFLVETIVSAFIYTSCNTFEKGEENEEHRSKNVVFRFRCRRIR